MKGSRTWLVLCAVHGVLSMLLWWAREPVVQLLIWRADGWLLQPWTLLTSAWVHLSTPHLIGNQLALGALTAAGWVLRPPTSATWAWGLSWPLTQLSLDLWPQVGYAVGLSGVLHAGLMVLAMHLLLGPMPRPLRTWGAGLALGVLVKLFIEHAWGQPVVWDPSDEMSIVQAAHLSGAFWGAMLGALSALRAWRQPASSS
ncbi:MAG: hypothetical protein KF871_00890 [Hydrogenophaga sp.]|uniref:rhomboid family intramembrane serine protease n=1 Tax=Hydrogenophaga sp. TaxID=1904254 RepID=UPI001DCFF043|nr:rhomboid family intramembrane serine protease [Hydrogenophaga sp.]MBX3608423.1 hypothetical protein [Hydrogenophaga sp.]